MTNVPEYRNIFKYALDALEEENLTRHELIERILAGFSLSDAEKADFSINGRQNKLKSLSGIVINDMTAKGIISREDTLYRKNEETTVAVRIDECEREILNLVKEAPKTKNEIKDALIGFFGTDKTPSVKDDNRLFTYVGQILKKLVAECTLDYDGSLYSVGAGKRALINSRSEVLTLKSTFLKRIHTKGGEFFEHYFINLISRYLARTGKTVIESYVTGGFDDGGIDGVVRTVDSLGFKEVTMIQMKNRLATVNETDVRGFYGAVCAKQGSRGIFATVSDFHPMAHKFLDGIDNCVGVNGDKIFSMACDTAYGIKREGKQMIIDEEIV